MLEELRRRIPPRPVEMLPQMQLTQTMDYLPDSGSVEAACQPAAPTPTLAPTSTSMGSPGHGPENSISNPLAILFTSRKPVVTLPSLTTILRFLVVACLPAWVGNWPLAPLFESRLRTLEPRSGIQPALTAQLSSRVSSHHHAIPRARFLQPLPGYPAT
ncbi:hypothetical protein B0J13DRAFT_269074 [Dactylonectria estremocensis]|uniref:Uncharacterized protein n=1 Tax=Dactylonectria estremocensis TaxID=1079267 RepID=A0A9P9D4G6_9HYPO|nr:hypothetical protein B0J13DRAFT_269074 [Dactylonectria estremocensis]